MSERTQKLSIRLLRDGVEPEEALRDGAALRDWPQLEGAKIALGTIGGAAPKWSGFLQLPPEDEEKLHNISAIGVVFLQAADRWFAISFGLGHVKLDPAKFEQDFGLKVVLNSVDPKLLRSADVRTPDENTLSRRSQTSRGSDQTAFAIDVERDIVRGLAGKPKDPLFASRVAGSDALTMERKLELKDLPTACSEAFEMYNKSEYQNYFKWIDQIKHVRDPATLLALEEKLVETIDLAIKDQNPDGLHLAFPVIYDPEKGSHIQYKGFRSRRVFTDLDIAGYFEALLEQGVENFEAGDLATHRVHEVDEERNDCGGKWPLLDCVATEVEHEGNTYVLSGGRWYRIDVDLAKNVSAFFENSPRVVLPPAEARDNEDKYNKRQKAVNKDLLCLDRKLITPSGWSTPMEVCDFLSKEKHLIHVKDKTSSSRLSHLFSQGTVSARVLVLDEPARDKIREKIAEVEGETKQAGFVDIIPCADDSLKAAEYTVVYAVISTGAEAKLPFFSRLTFRQASRELQVAGFKYAFAWIQKPKDSGEKKSGKKQKKSLEQGQ